MREKQTPHHLTQMLANYRPISLLPFTSKVLVKVVVTQSAEEHSALRCFSQVLELITGRLSMLVPLVPSAALDVVDHRSYRDWNT